MSALLDGARKLVSRSSDLGARIGGLNDAIEGSRGRVDDDLLDDLETVTDRVAGRLKLSDQHTVVAIAGATGSGKSSTFNALTGLELSSVGVRRPTTSWATACVWGSEGADDLLQWLGIPPRHQTMRDSMLDSSKHDDKQLEGVVLLDLPDHDSTEVAHHLEVDRLVQLADMLIWVLDPQKYADAAIHDRYLAPAAEHAEVMVVVLNQIDRVPEDRVDAMVSDVRRILDGEGLGEVPLFPISARQGTGVDALRSELVKRVSAKKATRTRIEADLKAAAGRLSEATGRGQPRELSRRRVSELHDALAEAGGVPVVVDAAEQSAKQRAGRATTWPLVSAVSRLKPDPLKKLGLDLGGAGRALSGGQRVRAPEATPVQRARVDTEVRALAEDASAGMAPSWVEAVRRASTARLDELGNRLDRTLAETDLGVARLPWWAHLVRLLQWILILTAGAGLVWTGLALVGGGLAETPEVAAMPLPPLMLIGGVAAGVVLAVVCRVLVKASARSRAAAADERLREGVNAVAKELVVDPITAELQAFSQVQRQLGPLLK